MWTRSCCTAATALGIGGELLQVVDAPLLLALEWGARGRIHGIPAFQRSRPRRRRWCSARRSNFGIGVDEVLLNGGVRGGATGRRAWTRAFRFCAWRCRRSGADEEVGRGIAIEAARGTPWGLTLGWSELDAVDECTAGQPTTRPNRRRAAPLEAGPRRGRRRQLGSTLRLEARG
jgi:hypothetical protein